MIALAAAEEDSWLGHRNPLAKLAAHLLLSLVLTVVFDPLTPLAFLVLALIVGRRLARIPARTLPRALAPFGLLGASLVVSNALFGVRPPGAPVLMRWGPLSASVPGLTVGLSLAERGMAIAAFSLILLFSTDPGSLVRSLVQQARLPARIAYPVLAAYRGVPLLAEEYVTIRLALRLRGQGRRRGVLGAIRVEGALLLPLLAGAIRRAERMAVAMDARGLNAGRPRTFYRQTPFERADGAMLLGAIGASVAILVVSGELGILRLWAGTLGL